MNFTILMVAVVWVCLIAMNRTHEVSASAFTCFVSNDTHKGRVATNQFFHTEKLNIAAFGVNRILFDKQQERVINDVQVPLNLFHDLNKRLVHAVALFHQVAWVKDLVSVGADELFVATNATLAYGVVLILFFAIGAFLVKLLLPIVAATKNLLTQRVDGCAEDDGLLDRRVERGDGYALNKDRFLDTRLPKRHLWFGGCSTVERSRQT